MKKRKLGNKNSTLLVTPIIFGAWGIGGPPFWDERDDTESIRAMEKAIDLGINMIDTAPVYGFGRSETLVGKVLKNRDDVLVATKCGLRWDKEELRAIRNDLSAESIQEELEQSLRRLGKDKIDLYQIHWPDPQREIEPVMETLALLKESGKIVEIGVSNFDRKLLEKAQKVTEIASIQPKYNILEREIETELLPYATAEDIGAIVYSPLASGLLTGKYDEKSDFSDWRGNGKFGIFQPEKLKKALKMVDNLKKLADSYNIPLTHIAIRWVAKRDGVTAGIVGANRPEQVEDNVKAFEVDIPDRLFKEIDAISSDI